MRAILIGLLYTSAVLAQITQIPGPSGSGSSAPATKLVPTLNTGTDTLSVSCPVNGQCIVLFGTATRRDATAATLTIVPATASSNHTAYLYMLSTGAFQFDAATGTTFTTCTAGGGATLNCSAVASPAFPADGSAFAIAEIQINTSGNFVAASLVDRWATATMPPKVVAGANMIITSSGDSTLTYTAAGGCDPTDFTKFCSFANFETFTGDNWYYTTCSESTYTNPRAGEPKGIAWIGSGAPCKVTIFSATGVANGSGIQDPFSSTNMRTTTTTFRIKRNTAHNFWWMWSNSHTTNADGWGVWWDNTGSAFKLVVRSGSADSGTPATITCSGLTTDWHTFILTTTVGVSNTVNATCDGGATATVSNGTIPAFSASTQFVQLSDNTSGSWNSGRIAVKIEGIQ